MGASMDASDQLDGISAAASRETSPEVSLKVYAEGGGIVPTVERTGADELIVSALEARVQSVCGKNLSDGDTGFEETKAIGVHLLPPSRA
jgi:hypothetical protein